MVDQPVYPDSVVIEVYLNSVWVDISADVVSPITGSSGLSGTSPLDRISSIGTCSMSLNNVDNRYTPGHPDVRSGWNRGVPLRVEATYLGVLTNIFWGRVEDIKLDSSEWGTRNAEITCLDYMNIPSQFPLKEIALETNKLIDQGITSLVAGLPIAPTTADYSTGISLFPTIFDDVKDNTRAVAEFQKLAISELGYVYIKRDDTLRVESREDRKGTRGLNKVVVVSGFLLKEDGDYLLKEDGDKIELDEADDVVFDNTMTEIDVEYGDGILNEAHVTAFPRKVGSEAVLFTLEEPIGISQFKDTTLKGKYSDPEGGNPIHGTNMQTPVATTDYLLNDEKNGGGVDLTSDLTVTANFFADGVEFTFSTDAAGWLTKCNVRGNPITKYNPIEITRKDAASITAYGVNSISIKQTYQDSIELGEIEAESIVEREREPDVEATRVRFIANNSDKEMRAFLNIDIGDLVHVKEDKNRLDSFYYIYSREYTIELGKIIEFSYGIKRTRCLQNGYTAIAVEFSGEVSEEVIIFPATPQVTDAEKTIIAQININAFQDFSGTLLQSADGADFLGLVKFSITDSADKGLFFTSNENDSSGNTSQIWKTATDTLVTGVDYTVAVSYDNSSPYNRPTFYINGVKSTTVLFQSVSGAERIRENPIDFIVGGSVLTLDEFIRIFDGTLKNVRYYNRILTPAEHLLSVTEVVTDGLVFQPLCVVTDRLTDYIDQALAETDKLIDNVFGVVGTPINSPTGRSAE